jgi:hypothetical protein
MKANHIPAKDRIKRRINRLEVRLDECMIRQRKRFYMFCKECDRTTIQVSMEGHHKWCSYRGLDAEIRHYKHLLEEQIRMSESPGTTA